MAADETQSGNAATSIDADTIAAALGIHRWQLAAMLHSAAADEFRKLASMTYAGIDIDEDRIDRARRLHAAAVACEVDLEAEAVASGNFERRTS